MSTWRLTIVCRPSTTCAAVTIGSTPRHGIAPCVCRPRDGDAEGVGAGHRRAGAIADHAGVQMRRDVQAEDRARRRVLERALGDHQLRAAFLARGRQLLGRLEDELDRAGEAVAQAGENARHAHQDRDVGVVAAGMHDADRLAVPGRLHLRRERHVGAFGDRQAVHVGTQRHHRAGPRALEQADDAGVGDLGADLVEAELAQVRGDDARGAELAVAELGVGVQIASPGDHLRLDAGDRRVDRGGEAVRSNAGVGHGGSRLPIT